MASIDELMSQLHRRAARLRWTGNPQRKLDAHLVAWAPLAVQTRRVLSALETRPEDRYLHDLLAPLAHRFEVNAGRADPGLADLAVIIGAIGDVLAGSPAVVGGAAADERHRLSLGIQAAVFAAARTTVDIAGAARQDHHVARFWDISRATAFAAQLPPGARTSSLERLTVPRTPLDTVEGAARQWVTEAARTFTNPRLVTGVALMDAAATIAIVCDLSATTMRDAARRRLTEPTAARSAAALLENASRAWREAAAWPRKVQLGGSAHEYREAANLLRENLNSPPLHRLTLQERMSALRVVVTLAQDVGEHQARAVRTLSSRGGLWIARERDNLRPPGVERRRIKFEWERSTHFHPACVLLRGRSNAAAGALLGAASAMDQTILPAAVLRIEPDHVVLVSNRIVAGGWEMVGPPAAQRGPAQASPAQSQVPIAPGPAR
jgi:hypothetical protein